MAKASTGGGSAQRARKKIKRVVSEGIVHVHATFNNTVITITDLLGNVLLWTASGVQGFKGSRKSTPFAAQSATEALCARAKEFGLQTLSVKINGPGPGRESVVRVLNALGFKVIAISDVTAIAHGGCTPAKRRRV